MDLLAISHFLAKFFGLYLIIMGLWLFVRRDNLRLVVQNMVNNPAVIVISGVTALLMGLLVLLLHPVWTMDWRGALTLLFGALPVAQGIMRLFFFDQMRPWAERMMMGNYPMIMGAIMLLLGVFFAYMGFGMHL